MQIKLTINELAKIVNIPASTIRYYCNNGIFEPSGQLENKYRYFTIGKIEELRLITYLRNLDVPLEEIKSHLQSRNLNAYENILDSQLVKTRDRIRELKFIEDRLEMRLEYLSYIKNLPPLNQVSVEQFDTRRILKLNKKTSTQMDFEVALLNFETMGDLPPSLIVGDQGFIVDLANYETRTAEEFIGMYMIAEHDQYKSHILYEEIPPGDWLTIYFRGDHNTALKQYDKLIAFSKEHNLSLGDYALERVLIDHFISNDPDNYITEIQIPIKKER